MQGELAAEQEHSLQLVMIVNTLRAERDSARQRLSTAEQRRVLNMAKRQLQASFSAAVADQGKLGSMPCPPPLALPPRLFPQATSKIRS